jgi:hypothetical protein
MISADVLALLIYLILFLPFMLPNIVLLSVYCFFNHFLTTYARYRRDAVRQQMQERVERPKLARREKHARAGRPTATEVPRETPTQRSQSCQPHVKL